MYHSPAVTLRAISTMVFQIIVCRLWLGSGAIVHSNDDANGRGAANEQHCKDIEPLS